jgi:hypothetical protein
MQLPERLNRSVGAGIGNALLALALAVTAGGCSTPHEPPTSSLLAGVHQTGGLCSTGPCSTNLTVYQDGRWELDDAASERRSGILTNDQVREIHTLITESELPRAKRTNPCPANYDGPRVTYTIGSEPEISIDDCITEIPASNPLIERLNRLFQELNKN